MDAVQLREPVVALQMGGEHGRLLRPLLHVHLRHPVHLGLLQLDLVPGRGVDRVTQHTAAVCGREVQVRAEEAVSALC